MIVNFEFLGNEPIENVITCMNFKVDKVVFFGYHEVVEVQKIPTQNFLKEQCNVRNVVFHELSKQNLPSILRTMRSAIEHEKGEKNQIYFDITGGENLILVAFGILSKECGAQIHYYDVPDNRLIELDEGVAGKMSMEVPAQRVKFSVDSYIKLRGGKINYGYHKKVKDIANEEFCQDVDNLWNVARRFWNYWNPFSMFLRENFKADATLSLSIKETDIQRILSNSNTALKKIAKLNEILNALHRIGAIRKLTRTNGIYRFTFKNRQIKDCLWDGGCILELYTYQKERQNCDDCQVGVHIDWDGVIRGYGEDVLNEVDVLVIRNNIPTFISCKSGRMKAQESLHALYELETVTKRFGGKYAKKVLAITRKLGTVSEERASEMKIEVRQER